VPPGLVACAGLEGPILAVGGAELAPGEDPVVVGRQRAQAFGDFFLFVDFFPEPFFF
jgi:hypothetical protein